MIGAALGLELRALMRSPLRTLILIFTLATGIFVIVQGQRDVGRWQEAIEAAHAKQEESRVEAVGFLDSGEVGPENRPWVDLTKPLWQDWYASTRLVREPAPLAGIAFASLANDVVAVRISRLADPMLTQGAKIGNPELEAAGGLDLVTVLALLLPLMILAIGVEVGSHERASGILPLVRVQSGRDRAWICARCIAVGILGGATGLLLVAVASVAAAADFGISLVFAGLVLAYVALWTALLVVVALVARHPSQGAVALGAAWIVLCVLVPAIGVERTAALAADDFALDLTVEARDADLAFRELDEETLYAQLLERFPGLDESMPSERPVTSFVEREGLALVALEERLARREALGQAQASWVERMSIASPAVAFSHALEAIAGRGPQAAQEYRRAVVGAIADRVERHIAGTWRADTLGVEEFEQLLASTPERVESRVRLPEGEAAILVAWFLALVALAGLLSRGMDTSRAALLGVLLVLTACQHEPGAGAGADVAGSLGEPIPLPHAQTFEVYERDGFRVVDIEASVVTWGGTAGGPPQRARLVLVPHDATPPPLTGDLAGATLIRTPVMRLAVNGQPHEAMARALGIADRLVAVGGHNSYDDDIRGRARAGEIQQIGYGWHQPPILDALLASEPDVLLARLADLTHIQHIERVESLGIPVVPVFLDAEPHYLGKVEWTRLLGMLTGKEREAEAFVAQVGDEVERLKRLAADQPRRSLLWAWYQSSGDAWSVTQRNAEAALIRDANAELVLGAPDDPELDVFSRLSTEQLLRDATHADCWMIRDPLSEPFARTDLLQRFEAVREGCVFWQPGLPNPQADAWEVWEMGAIRPDWLLADLIKIVHPALRDGTWRYFEPEDLENPRVGTVSH